MEAKMETLLLGIACLSLIQICSSNEFHNLDDVAFEEDDHPHAKCTRRRMDVIFILDESSSIPPAIFRKEKRFVAKMLKEFDIGRDGTRVGILTFADNTRIHANLKDFTQRHEIWGRVKKIRQFGGNTNTGEALRILRTHSFHPAQGARVGTNIPQICIVVTDGGSQRHDLTKLQALHAKAKGFIMFSVGVGPDSDEEELKNIASNIHYILSHEDHVHAAEVSCDATPAPPLSIIPGCADTPIDLIFVLDNSNSIPHGSYDKMMEFVSGLVMGFNIGKDDTRVSLIKFASDAVMEFNFKSYYDREEMADAVRTTDRMRGGTYTYYALKMIETDVLTADHGARPGVPKVVLIITDGNSATRRHTLWQAKILREKYDVRFFAIGVGHEIDQSELVGIVGEQNKNDVFMAESYDFLIEFRETMVLKACGDAPSVAPRTTPKPGKYDILLTPDFKPQPSNPIAMMNKDTRLKFDLKIQNAENADIDAVSRRQSNYAVDFYFSQSDLRRTPVRRAKVHKLKNIVEPGLEFGLIGNGPASRLITFDTSGKLPGRECSKHIWFCACVREGRDAEYKDDDTSNNCQCRPASELISCSPDIAVNNFDPKARGKVFKKGEPLKINRFTAFIKNEARKEPGNDIQKAKGGDNYAIDLYFAQADLTRNPLATKSKPFPATVTTGDLSVPLEALDETSKLYADALVTLPSRECEKFVWLCACVREGSAAKYVDADNSNNCECKDVSPDTECLAPNPDIAVTELDIDSANKIFRKSKTSDLSFDVKIKDVDGSDIERVGRGDKNYAMDFYVSQDNLERTPLSDTTAFLLTNIKEPSLDFGLIAKGQASRALSFVTSGKLPSERCNKYVWFCACVREGSDAKYADADKSNNCKCKDSSLLISCSPDIKVTNFDPKQTEFLRGEDTEIDSLTLKVENGAPRKPGNDILEAPRGDNYEIVLHFAQADLARNPSAKKSPAFPASLKTGDLSVALASAKITSRQTMKAKVTLPDEDGCAQYVWLCACVKEGDGAEYTDANPNNNCECKDVSPFMKCVFLPLKNIYDSCIGKAADVFFIVDSSRDVSDKDYDTLLAFAQFMALGMDVAEQKTRVGVIVAGDRPEVGFRLNQNYGREEAALAIPKVKRASGRNMNTADALKMMQTYNEARYGGRAGALKVGMVITSRTSTNPGQTRVEAKKARDAGYILFALGADGYDYDELEGIADIPHSETRLFSSFRYDRLIRNTDAIVEEMCRTTPPVPKPDIKVRNFDPKETEFKRGVETPIPDIGLNVENGAPSGNNIKAAFFGDNYAIDLYFAQADLTTSPNAKKTPPFPATLKTGDLSVALEATKLTPKQRMKAKVVLPDADDCDQYLWLCACVREGNKATYKDSDKTNNCECKDVSPFVKCVALPDRNIFDSCIDKKADVFFIIDTSDGLSAKNYEHFLKFAQFMEMSLDVARDKTRVGVIVAGDNAVVSFPLDKYFDRKDAAVAIMGVKRERGRSTNTADAIVLMQEYNQAKYGGRSDALKVGLVLTSKASANPRATKAEAKNARDAGYAMFALGADGFDFDELEDIVDYPHSETRLFTSFRYERLIRNTDAIIDELCRSKVPAPKPDLALNEFKVDDKNPMMVKEKEANLDMEVVLSNKAGSNIFPVGRRDKNYALDFYVSQANLESTKIADTKAVKLTNVRDPELGFGLIALGPPSSLLKFATKGTLPSQQCNRYVWFCACAREGEDAAYEDADPTNNCKCADASKKIYCSPDIQVTNFDPDAADLKFKKGEEVELGFLGLKVKNGATDLPGNGIQKASGGDNYAIDLFFAQDDLVKNPSAKKSPPFGTTLNTGDLSVGLRGASTSSEQRLKSKITLPSDDCSQWVWLCACVREGSGAKYQDSNPNNNCECKDVSPNTQCDSGAAACVGKPVDVVFIVDHSNSIRNDDYVKMIDFVETLIGSFDVGTDKARIGMVTYASDSMVRFELNKYTDSATIIEVVDTMRRQHGGTQTGDALEEAREHTFQEEHGARPGVLKVALVITDGVSANRRQTLAEAKKTRDHGIRVYAIGVGPGVDQTELLGIAGTEFPDQVFSAQNFEALQALHERIIQDTCTATPPPPHGATCKGKPVDVVFVIDNSNSIRNDDYVKMMDFVETLIGSFEVGLDTIRVGLVTYASDALVRFELNKYTDAAEIIEFMDTMRRQHGGTQTGDALQEAREHTFQPEHGARPNVKKILFVITDGVSANRRQTLSEAKITRDQGILIYALGIGAGVEVLELNGIAGPENPNQVFSAQTFEALQALNEKIVTETCSDEHEEKFEFMFADVPADAPLKQISCDVTPSDVVFVLDNSASVGRDEYHDMIDFVKSLLREINIGFGPNSTRVSVVSFSNSARVGFYLDDNRDLHEYMKALNNIRRMFGQSNTAEALRVTRVSALSPFRGARDGVSKLIVLITDGRSSNRARTEAEAAINRAEGIEMVVIGVGKRISTSEINAIVGYGNRRSALSAESFARLSKVKDDVIKARCHRG